jgi:signal transduction histidine kinase
MSNPGSTRTAEYRFRHKDGNWHIIESRGKTYLDESGSPRLIINSRDITERRRLEERLFQSQKMETIGKLAGGIAHDINNVFMAIGSYSELLELKLDQDHLSFQEIHEIKKATEHGASLIRKLLAFSRKQIALPTELLLHEVIQEDTEMLRRVLGKHIELKLQLENTGKVHADRTLLEQALLSLCQNAKEAMPEGGSVEIRTCNKTICENFARDHIGSIPGEYVLLEIKDNGCGISEQMLPHLFEPFYTTKDLGKGVGLGLPSVYGIVKQNNGYIHCDSKIGIGTSFQIYLPRIG